MKFGIFLLVDIVKKSSEKLYNMNNNNNMNKKEEIKLNNLKQLGKPLIVVNNINNNNNIKKNNKPLSNANKYMKKFNIKLKREHLKIANKQKRYTFDGQEKNKNLRSKRNLMNSAYFNPTQQTSLPNKRIKCERKLDIMKSHDIPKEQENKAYEIWDRRLKSRTSYFEYQIHWLDGSNKVEWLPASQLNDTNPIYNFLHSLNYSRSTIVEGFINFFAHELTSLDNFPSPQL